MHSLDTEEEAGPYYFRFLRPHDYEEVLGIITEVYTEREPPAVGLRCSAEETRMAFAQSVKVFVYKPVVPKLLLLAAHLKIIKQSCFTYRRRIFVKENNLHVLMRWMGLFIYA